MENLLPKVSLRGYEGTSQDAHAGWLLEQTQRQPRDRGDFKIAIICALPLEFDAICLLLDELWDNHGLGYGRAPNDYNYYITGRLGVHNVVLLLLPGMGKVHAASATRGLRISYPDVRFAVLVGICGGVPIEWKNGDEILLGDVIVSERLEQFDMGKQYPDGFQIRTDRSNSLGKPAKSVMSLLAGLTTQFGRARLQQRTAFFLGQLQSKAEDLGRRSYAYPGTSQDKLFNSNYPHQHYGPVGCSCGRPLGPRHRVCDLALLSSCVDTGCDEENLISRVRLEMRQSLEKEQDSGFEIQQPAIMFGVVASGDTVMKSGSDRDRIAKKVKALAFEMEGAGLWEELPSIVVKGVCDYADSHKNKKWQDFAAATAAAVTCAILERCERNDDPRAGVLENPIVGFMHPTIGGPGQQSLPLQRLASQQAISHAPAMFGGDDFPLQEALQVLPTEIRSTLSTRFDQETISTKWAETILAFLESKPEVSKTLSNTAPFGRFTSGLHRHLWYQVLSDDDQTYEQVTIEHETVSLSVLGFLVRKDKQAPKPSKKQVRNNKSPPSLEGKLGNARIVPAVPLNLNKDLKSSSVTFAKHRRLYLFYCVSPESINDNSLSQHQAFIWSLIVQILLWRPRFRNLFLSWLGTVNLTHTPTPSFLDRLTVFFQSLVDLNGAPVVISVCHGEWLNDDFHHQSSQFLADLYSGDLTKNVQVQLIITVTSVVTAPSFLNPHQVLNRETEANECLSLLKFEGQFLRRDEVATAESGTNDWIWEHQAFISWSQKSSGILWIEGKAGCGKSVLAKTIRSKIGQTWKSRLQGVPLPPISDWFYSTRHGDTTKSHILCLRSFLSQILAQNKASFHQYSSIYRQKGENQEKWTIDDYEGILLSLASQGIPAVCIIDAMDESDDSGGTYELRSRIINLMANLCRETRSCLRFIVTSRYTADMNRALRKLSRDEDLLSLVVLEKENREDIAIIIANGLTSVNDAINAFESDGEEEMDFTFSTPQRNGEAGILARIGDHIAENADGVILWVKLVMQALIGRARRGFYTLEMLESDLEALPHDLVDFYRFAVSELEARFSLEELRITRSALMWVVGASTLRPLALDELFEALGLETDNKALLTPNMVWDTRQASQLQAKSWLGFYRQLRFRCGPFIELILPQTQFVRSNFRENTEIKPHFTVQLLHRTVKEFLHNREGSGVLSFSQAEAEYLVQRSMRSYLARVLPSNESAHSPVPAKLGDDLEVTVRAMSEYLDKKFLLDFVLTNLPEEELLRHLMIFEKSVNPNLMEQRDNWPWNDSLEHIATRYLRFACENGLARTILIQLRIASILLLSWPTSLRYGPLAVALQKCARDYSRQAATAPQESLGNLRFQRKELVEAIDMLVTFSQHEQNLEWDAWAPARTMPFWPQNKQTRLTVPDRRALSNVLETMEIFEGRKPKTKDKRTTGRSKGPS